nr:ABC transporter transmembrane domain-containing protein [Paenibacillus sp. AR247]
MRKEGWIVPYIRAHWGRCLLIIGLGSLALLFAAGLMFTSGLLISKSALRPENILMVYVPIVLVRTFGIGRAVLFYAERLAGHDTVLRIVSSMRERLYRILEPQALWIQSRFRAGDVLGVLSTDIEHLQDVYLRTVFPAASALVMYAAAAAAVGRWDLRFALVLALYMFILVGILPWLSLLMTKAQTKLAKTQKAGMYRQLTDAVLGMGDWVISGREAQFLAAYEVKAGEAARTDAKLRAWVRFRQLAAQCVVGLILLTVLVWAAGMHADGKLPAVLIAAFVLVVFPVTDALLPVSEALEHLPRYRDSLRRLSDLEGEESTEKDR